MITSLKFNFPLSDKQEQTIMLKTISNLDYTVLLCEDIESMKAFYGDVLEFPLVRDFGAWVEFQVGATRLTLTTRGTGYDGVRDYHGPAPRDAASLQLAFRVAPAQVDACYAELLQRGVTMIQEPVTHPETGHRTLFFTDPEHNILEIYAEV
jgi:lactoylglutathione lyase